MDTNAGIVPHQEEGSDPLPLHPNRCGPCDDCAAWLWGVGDGNASRAEARAAERAYWRRMFETPPTAEAFFQHVERYGPDGVKAMAKFYDVDLRVRRRPDDQPKRRRRTTAQLRDEYAALAGRGLVRAAIADTLNISDRRAAELERDLRAPSEPKSG